MINYNKRDFKDKIKSAAINSLSTKPTNLSSTVKSSVGYSCCCCRRIIWVYFTILWGWCLIKKTQPKKYFFYFTKWNFLAPILKNFLYFGYGTFLSHNFLVFQERNIWARKIKKKPTLKKFILFQDIELSSPKLKKLLIFQEGTFKV